MNSFEAQFNLSINVDEPLGIDQVRPMRLSPYLGNNHNDLLLYKRHCSRSISLSRSMSKQINTNTRNKFICKRCLNYFYTEHGLNQHVSLCHTHENTVDIMPNEGEVVKFKNHERKFKHPFVLYADESYTTLNAKHIPCGVCIHMKSEVPELESTLLSSEVQMRLVSSKHF